MYILFIHEVYIQGLKKKEPGKRIWIEKSSFFIFLDFLIMSSLTKVCRGKERENLRKGQNRQENKSANLFQIVAFKVQIAMIKY